MSLNQEQQRAVAARNTNILVSASAGAGKTKVLIERLMSLITQDKVEVSEILAMTFTEAAAAEMKKRLAASLSSTYEQTKDPFLKAQLANLESANISTIHGFCLRILKEYYYMIDLPKKRVNHPLDEQQASMLKTNALESVLAYAYQQPWFPSFVEVFSDRPESLGTLEASINQYANVVNAKADPQAYIKHCMDYYKPIDTIAQLPKDIQHYFFQGIELELDVLIDALTQVEFEYSDESNLVKEERYQKAKAAILARDYESYRAVLKATVQLKSPAKTKSAYYTTIAEVEDRLLQQAFSEKEYVSFHNANVEVMHHFIELTQMFLAHYEKEKQEYECIDFSDMEHYAIAILQAKGGHVANLLKQQFKTIMVDEFQDSNDVQDTLIKLIAKEDNVFRVGDIKQSIYGFRNASPEIMKGFIDTPDAKNEVIFFKYNYRSKESIVEFTNQYFKALMNIEGLSSSYESDDVVSVGRDQQKENNVPVQIHIIDKNLKKSDAWAETPNDLTTSYIANQILKIKAEKGYAFKDFAILVRGNAKMKSINEELSELGIPCFYANAEDFYKNVSITSVISFVKALVNMHDDHNFIALCTSCFYQIPANDLAKAKLEKAEDSSYATYFENDERLASFYELREHIYKQPVSKVMKSIYDINDFYMSYTTLQDKANLDLLYEIVCQKEQEEAMGIQGFLRYIEQVQNLKVPEAFPLGEGDDVVRLMTIHKSKGLEFKVVFLVSSQNKNAQSNFLATDDELGIAVDYVDAKNYQIYNDISKIAIKNKQYLNSLEEELRVLYVAITRAECEMHVVGTGNETEILDANFQNFYNTKGFIWWMRMGLHDVDASLYHIEYVDEVWTNQTQETKKMEYTQTYYDKQASEVVFASPSDSETFVQKPQPFSLQEDVGFERGSNLHRMVEVLPNTTWDDALLTQVANAEAITLHAHDMQVLQKLQNEQLYQQASSFHEVYHEFAFMVKDDQEIMHGYMDYLAIDETDVIMIDFKSDRGVDEQVLYTRYHQQIKAYQKALHILYPTKNIQTYIYAFELAKMILIK
ncbi:ATP-dependent helicase/nuclease subunit A [Breznakia blatticola]|uniref:DNA 3'-5' helicase n=1 Tax=Breznakia blatticola TaxID=1754012 RepID=A0A4R7ZPF9_9FIRM|nr:UvrD-helicase domain-containing protein [Breznakia blatticola]TDW19793.1 ATP-dependent helicase/nuclease subunit A [Breznakia blatticola]